MLLYQFISLHIYLFTMLSKTIMSYGQSKGLQEKLPKKAKYRGSFKPRQVTESNQNILYVNPKSKFSKQTGHIWIKGFIFKYEMSPLIDLGCIGMSRHIRDTLCVDSFSNISIYQYQTQYQTKDTDIKAAQYLEIKVKFQDLVSNQGIKIKIDHNRLVQQITKNITQYYIRQGQTFTVKVDNICYQLIVKTINNKAGGVFFLSDNTDIECRSNHKRIKIKSQKQQLMEQYQFGLLIKFSSWGKNIGALNQQLQCLANRLGIKMKQFKSQKGSPNSAKVKTILIHGPPGTGKTLMIRQLAHFIKKHNLKTVKEPFVFANDGGGQLYDVQKTFQKAKRDQDELGDDQSPLYVIIFDEIYQLGKQKGTHNPRSVTVDFILKKYLDGTEGLNNVIVIGITNQKDQLYRAFQSSERQNELINIETPDEEGIKKNLQIFIMQRRKQNLVSFHVSSRLLAKYLKGCTGAELEIITQKVLQQAKSRQQYFNIQQRNINKTYVTSNDFLRQNFSLIPRGKRQGHDEVKIPNEDGRKQILQIHTRTLKQEKLLDNDVSLSKLAFLTKNYTVSELQALVRNASSFAMTKENDFMDFSKNFTLKKDTKVTMKDFERAILEVPPSFGIDQQNFQVYTREKLIPYGKSYQNILNFLEETSGVVLNSSKQLVTVLMHGPQGSGKTSIAANFAKQSKFTYVKLISPQRYVGIQQQMKINDLQYNDHRCDPSIKMIKL